MIYKDYHKDFIVKQKNNKASINIPNLMNECMYLIILELYFQG